MSDNPFIGELMLVGFNFCPRGWADADGQILSISQNTALFSLYGTIYGGDGRTTFALPDLRGRSVIHTGTGPSLSPFPIGQKGGAETVTLNASQSPPHTHPATLHAQSAADADAPAGNVPAPSENDIYSSAAPDVTMRAGAVTVENNTGGGQPFNIRDPFLTMRWCVALTGIYPSRN